MIRGDLNFQFHRVDNRSGENLASGLHGIGISGLTSGISKAISTIVVGLTLSGCVATALTPIAPSPALNTQLALAPQNSETTSASESTSNETAANGTDQSKTSETAASGVTVPVQRPKLPGDPPQLALADTGSASIAAQKAESVVLSSNSKTTQKSATNKEALLAPAAVTVAPPKKKAKTSFFASLFKSKKTTGRKRTVIGTVKSTSKRNENRKVAVFRPTSKKQLPGVRKLGLFGIYSAKEGAREGYDNAVRLASIGGLARTSPNGLRIQTPRVQVACLRPGLVRIIKQVQRRYGRVPIVTSGYRSPAANRRARGARNSMHIYCKAADIQVAGVSKWALAKYLRSIPGRGGVGTYCHTKSVHIDIGSKRDWNWRCRRGKRVAKRGYKKKRKG